MMKTIIRILIISVICLICPKVSGANTTASLEKLAAYAKASPSLKIDFSVRVDKETSGKGTLTLGGSRFVLQVAGISAWFDGKTQWVYQKQTNEVTVTTPTAAELAEINPMVLITNYKKHFKVTGSKTQNGITTFTLKPLKTGTGIKTINISLRVSNNQPSRLVVTSEDGAVTTMTVTSCVRGKKLPDTYYKYNKANCPGAVVNDMR